MSARYLKTSSVLVKRISESVTKGKRKKEEQLLSDFTKLFYEFSSADELKEFSTEELSAIVGNAYKFFSTHKGSAPKIRVFSPSLDTDGWEKDYTVIEMINKDTPFIVDSISEEINRLGYTIDYLAHPVIDVGRDDKGKIVTLVNGSTTELNSVNKESFIHARLSHKVTDKEAKQLSTALLSIMTSVRSCVRDWQKILESVSKLRENTVSTLEFLTQNLHPKTLSACTEDIHELEEFLHWLVNNNFVFLGYIEQRKSGKSLKSHAKSALGLCQTMDLWLPKFDHVTFDHQQILQFIHITKSSERSPVHRPHHMDLISIPKLNDKGDVIGVAHIFGMFTSVVYYQSSRRIPLLRRKIMLAHQHSGFPVSGHSGKALSAILEDFPRDELFQAQINELFDTAMGIVTLTTARKLKVFLRQDESERFISCLVFLPKERMNTEVREEIEHILSRELDGTVSNHYTQIAESHLARLQIIIKTVPGHIPTYNQTAIEQKLTQAIRNWSDVFHEEVITRLGASDGAKVFSRYSSAFSPSYTSRFSSEDAYYDTLKIEQVIETNRTVFDIYESRSEDNKDVFYFKIYTPDKQTTLSHVMPMLENFGLHTLDEHTYRVTPNHADYNVWIHRFRFTVPLDKKPKLTAIKYNFEEAITRLWHKELQDDGINKLILYANLQWRHVGLIRAYVKYLHQASFNYNQYYIQDALSHQPRIIQLIINLFEVRFAPDYKGNRQDEQNRIVADIERILGRVSNLAEDRVFRSLLEVVLATRRTNFFQTDKDGNYKSYISFKFSSAEISILPKPRPYAEIFVYSARMAGIHLRGGKVARGGLRWSDRREDFRTEVLGLMKAQMTKNTVIIPVGSKGGFVVKQLPTEGGRDALMKEGIECYKTFLRGLLDLTDNIIDEKIVPPDNVVRHDGDDPYLVVAADKGTATFSDIANEVAAEYNFWLGDAFASGGSVGYDHKKMGITAKGAWISVQRHFREMGIDVQKEPFTTIAVGDMAGDVFGNGMLSSKHIKLVAAFNHMHIFLDPDPDPDTSYKERKRLFSLPRSSWLDYNPDLISKGGGVFERSAKSIKLSTQVKEILGTDDNNLTPDELIKAILKAPVDLLWNGGIGTYVKSKIESHDDAGDKANDTLRINGEDLRVKVVGEGGNLGFTQRGRIEYAMKGGRINTDSVDNSAGVDCSDHEVNIKIALDSAVKHNRLTQSARNKLLEEMTDEVADLVLRDNHLQTQFLTIAQTQGTTLLEGHARAMESLEDIGLLDREIEFLPNKEDIARRHAEGKGLTRPEISVIMAYSKLALYDELLNSKLPDDRYYAGDLEFYFPEKLRKKFTKEVHNHQLRREIVATSVTNSLINRIGVEMYYLLKESTGMEGCDIARAYTIVRDIFGLRHFWSDIENVQDKISVEIQVELFTQIRQLILRVVFWILKHHSQLTDNAKAVNHFGPGIESLYECLPAVLSAAGKEAYEKRLECYKRHHVPDRLARSIAGLQSMSSGCNIVQVSHDTKFRIKNVAKVYYEIGERLQLDWLCKQLDSLNTNNSYWQKTSIKTLIDDIATQQRRLTKSLIKHICPNGKLTNDCVDRWIDMHQSQVNRYMRFIDDMKAHDNLDFSMVLVAIGKVKEIAGA